MRRSARRSRRSHRARARSFHRRRSYRRNPVAFRGIVGQLVQAGKRTFVILAGQAATNFVASRIPFLNGSVPAQVAKQIGVGLVISYGVRRVAPRYAEDALVGALLAPATTVFRQIPILGGALAGAPPGLGLWAGRITKTPLRGAPPGLGRWTEGAAKAGGGGQPESSYYN